MRAKNLIFSLQFWRLYAYMLINQFFQVLTIYSDDFNLELSAWLTYHLGYLGLTQTQGAKDSTLSMIIGPTLPFVIPKHT